MSKTTTFTGYPDAFAATPRNTTTEESISHKLARALRKSKRKNKKLKQTIKEQRIAEEKRIAEAKRNAEEAKNKEQSFMSKIEAACLKAIPVVLTAIATIFVKNFFSRRKGYTFA